MLEEVSGLTEGQDFHLVFSPERVLTGRVFADLRKLPQAGRRPRRGRAPSARVEFYEAVLDFDERPDLDRAQRRLGPRQRRGLRAGQARRDDVPRRQHRPGQPVRALRRRATASTCYEVIDACNSQPYSHIHRPGIAVGGHCIPVYPRLYLWNDPDATVVRAAREANAAMPEYAVDAARGRLRRPHRRAGRGARRLVPRRGQGDRVLRRLPDRRGAQGARRRRRSCTTRCTPTRSSRGSASRPTTSASRSTPPSCRPTTPSTASLGPADLPGVQAHRRRPPRHRPGPLPGRHAPRHRSRAALSP